MTGYLQLCILKIFLEILRAAIEDVRFCYLLIEISNSCGKKAKSQFAKKNFSAIPCLIILKVTKLQRDFFSETVSNELVFITTPRLQVVEQGDEFLLECLVASLIRPQVRWLKDSRQIIVDGVRIRRVGVSSILVSRASIEDTGLYTCRASNNDDSIDRAVSVEVRAPPRITTRPTTKVAVETADVELECGTAAARPEARVNWYKNGEAIIGSEYFVIEPNR